MVSLSDNQLKIIMDTAADIDADRRDQYLQRIGAMLAMRGRGHFNDADVSEVARLASCGLVHQGSQAVARETTSGETVRQKTVVHPWCR
jgi:Mg-chelatase subunit ChlI